MREVEDFVDAVKTFEGMYVMLLVLELKNKCGWWSF